MISGTDVRVLSVRLFVVTVKHTVPQRQIVPSPSLNTVLPRDTTVRPTHPELRTIPGADSLVQYLYAPTFNLAMNYFPPDIVHKDHECYWYVVITTRNWSTHVHLTMESGAMHMRVMDVLSLLSMA